MAGRSGFGGAIKLTGESEYKKALQEITRNLKEVTAEMKVVTTSYSDNDKSITATKAKTEALIRVQEEQRRKLEILQNQYEAMSQEYTVQTQKHNALKAEIEKESSVLTRLGTTVGETSDEYQKQKAKIEALVNELSKSEKAQEANEKSMSSMRVQMSNAQADINRTSNALNDLGNEAETAGTKAKSSGDGFTVFKGILANLATDAITSVLSGLTQLSGAIVDVGKQAYSSYANYEQLVGGVETLFGSSSEKLIAYANEAYKTAGVSANEYMEQATAFSATLLQGLAGDTETAVEYADMAIRDMADNANKMGTDMASIQNAYQGFAKDTYTMLDNLKLGYGGTQGEMARLINDSGVLGDSIEVTAESVKDVPFDKIIEAIHVIQQEIGITGTTTAEASETIEGSAKALSASWQNLLTGMASDTADMDGLITNFTDSLLASLDNMLPRISKLIQGAGKTISGLAKTLLPEIVKIIPEVITMIPPILTETIPLLLDTIKTVVSDLMTAVPEQILPMISELIPQILSGFFDAIPQVWDAGIRFMVNLAQGIISGLPEVISQIPTILSEIISVFTTEVPRILLMGKQMAESIATGLQEAIPMLTKIMPDVINQVSTALNQVLPLLLQSGGEIINTLISGVVSALPLIIDLAMAIMSACANAMLQNMPIIVESGINLLISLIDGIQSQMPILIEMFPGLVMTIAETILSNLPIILEAGVSIIYKLGEGILSMIKTLISNVWDVNVAISDTLAEIPKKALDIGKNIVSGLWEGIKEKSSWLADQIDSFCSDIVDSIKDKFEIASPSKLMKNEVGKYLAEGIGVGFVDEMENVSKQMQDSIPTSFDVNATQSGSAENNYDYMINAFRDALLSVKIEMDDEEMGKFVDKTVSNLVFS